MKVELPSGAWVEVRDKLNADDKFETQGSFTIPVDDEGHQQMPSGIQNILMKALLARIITAWGGPGLDGEPVPAQNINGTAALGLIDLDDYNILEDAALPLLRKVTFGGPNRLTRNATPQPSSGS